MQRKTSLPHEEKALSPEQQKDIQLKELNERKAEFIGAKILAKKIDFAYDVFKRCQQLVVLLSPKEYSDHEVNKLQEIALNFLKDILDTHDVKKIHTLMQLRAHALRVYPESEYIPGKAPHLSGLPRAESAASKSQYLWRRSAHLALASSATIKKILAVDKDDDISSSVKYLTAAQRAPHRVIIKDGVFFETSSTAAHTFTTFDTTNMTSHSKSGLAAFTINYSGEISIFNHIYIADKIAHSSMNAGASVIAAGEIKISNGKLIGLTDHSGHYKPDLLNMRNLLLYLKDQGVPLDNVLVELHFPIDPKLKVSSVEEPLSKNNEEDDDRIVYHADDILKLDPKAIIEAEIDEEDSIEIDLLGQDSDIPPPPPPESPTDSESETDSRSDSIPPPPSDEDDEIMTANPLLSPSPTSHSSITFFDSKPSHSEPEKEPTEPPSAKDADSSGPTNK